MRPKLRPEPAPRIPAQRVTLSSKMRRVGAHIRLVMRSISARLPTVQQCAMAADLGGHWLIGTHRAAQAKSIWRALPKSSGRLVHKRRANPNLAASFCTGPVARISRVLRKGVPQRCRAKVIGTAWDRRLPCRCAWGGPMGPSIRSRVQPARERAAGRSGRSAGRTAAPRHWHPLRSTVLEAGRRVGAQTVTLARHCPGARFTSVDISADSLAAAVRARIDRPRLRLLRPGVSRGRRYRLPGGTGM
jgi:hypothetical protein